MFNRSFKRLIAGIGIAAILFAQMAVAAYACPTVTGQDESMGMNMPMVMSGDHEMAGMASGCEVQDTKNPNLCREHHQFGSQSRWSVETTPHIVIPPVAMVPLTIIKPIEPSFASSNISAYVLQIQASAPPLLTRFSVLRI